MGGCIPKNRKSHQAIISSCVNLLHVKRKISKGMSWAFYAFLWIRATSLLAQGSGLPVEYYSVNDGLSDRLVTDIEQTKDGLLWLSTPNGLNRFDGYEFVVFHNNPNSPHRISNANIRELHQDVNGRLVIVYRGGYALFDLLDPLTHQLETVRLLPKNGVQGIPRALTVDRAGNIFTLSIQDRATVLYQYKQDGTFRELFRVAETHKQTSINIDLLPLADGSFLIHDGEKGTRHFSRDGRLLRQMSDEDFLGLDNDAAYPGSTTIFHQDRSGKVWIALRSQPGMYHYFPAGRRLEYAPALPRWQYYTQLWEDQAGNLLLGNAGKAGEIFPLAGLTIIRPDGRQYDFSRLLAESRFLVSAFSKNFFKNFVLGIDTGLKIVQNRQSRVQTYLAKDVGSDKRGAVMRGIDGDGRGNVYMAREVDNWYRLNTDSNRLDTLRMLDELTGEPLRLACGLGIRIDQSGYIWGTSCLDGRTGRLHRYDPETDSVRTFYYDHTFSALTLGRDGKIWLCADPPTPKGILLHFDPETEQFVEFVTREGQNPLRDASPRFVLEARNGLLWVGTEDGLYRVDREKQEAKVYQAEEKQGLASNVVYAIHEDKKGRLWLGTTYGFNIFDPETERFLHYDQQDGLVSNTVCGFAPDENGNYWISTYNGLSYFEPETETFHNFFRKEGLSHNEFNRFSYYRDDQGNFYFGGVNGMNVFRTEDLLVDEETPTPVLTRFSRYDKRQDTTIVQVAGWHEVEAFVIHSSDSYFAFHYTLPAYTSPRRNQYQTFVRGYDKEWSYQGSTPLIRLNRLPPGDYELLVKGADANGNWSEEPLRVPIVVEPAFYETFWFYLLVFALLVGLAYLFFQYRLEQRLQMERIRTKLSSDLHDEVSGLLAGIAMQTDMLQTTVKDRESLDRIQQMGEVSRKAMSKMSDVIWSIDSRKDRVEDLIIRMREHADEMLSPLDITYDLKVDDGIDSKRKIPVTLRQNLYFIFKEAVNNIAKHSRATKVHIQLENDGSEFHMSIADNGTAVAEKASADYTLRHEHGKPEASAPPLHRPRKKKTGQGLSNLRMRAARIDAEIDISTGGEGYTVALRRRRFA